MQTHPGCWERRLARAPYLPRHHGMCVFPWDDPSPEGKPLGAGSQAGGLSLLPAVRAPGTGRPEEMDAAGNYPSLVWVGQAWGIRVGNASSAASSWVTLSRACV